MGYKLEAAERRESTDKHQKPNRKHYLLVIPMEYIAVYTKSNFDYIDTEFIFGLVDLFSIGSGTHI